jgi:hypothetical protein
MGMWPDHFESQFYNYFDVNDGLRAYTLTGVAVLTFQGGGGGRFKRDTLLVKVDLPDLPDFPPKNALQLVHWAPLFTLNSISNDGVANDAAWAVDGWELETRLDFPTRDIAFNVALAVGDADGFILRVGYMISLLGRLV